ncbi:hypothetical protein FNF31_03924 [Cafeteria roenbergensis]|uniref:Guanine nucleotide-binding protein-like 1 n=1 Tax=Cafeteria roenbergensis TaxID=33653 RepID=A0A5A8DAJ0_CAFRO|nr:hypothetical protein FNF31_03924 [Cafeteria roenbergensis]
MPKGGGGGGGGGAKGRKQPFSGKAKKEYLKAKRERRAAEGAVWEDRGRPSESEPTGAGAASAASIEGRLTTSLGKSGKENQLSTVVVRETDAAVEARKRVATQPVNTSARGMRAIAPEPSVDYATVEIPRSVLRSRSAQSILDAGEDVASAEAAAFRLWLRRVYGSFSPEQLSTFEHNVLVWQQLWRTVEGASVVVVVADARNPLFHLPPNLYEYLAVKSGRPVIVAMTKADLCPPAAVAAWRAYLLRRYPGVRAVVPFTASASTAAGEERMSTRRRAIRAAMRSYDAERKAARAEGVLALLKQAGASEVQAEAVRAGIALSSGTGRGGVSDALQRAGIGIDGAAIPVPAATGSGDREDDSRKGKHRRRKAKKAAAAGASSGAGGGGKGRGRAPDGDSDDEGESGAGGGDGAAGARGSAGPGGARRQGRGKKGKAGRRGRNAQEYYDRLHAAEEEAALGLTSASGARAGAAEVARSRAEEVAKRMGGEVAPARAARPAADTGACPAAIEPPALDVLRAADWASQPRVVVGVVGHPNVGKSSLINTLTGAKRVSVSRTPGHTKRMQHIAVCPGLTLLDCPGLLFPHCYGPRRPRAEASGDDDAGLDDKDLEELLARQAGPEEDEEDGSDGDSDDSGDSSHDDDDDDDDDNDDDDDDGSDSAGRRAAARAEPPKPAAAARPALAGGSQHTEMALLAWEADLRRHRAMQQCLGVMPLAQVREPYTAVRFLAERLPLERMYGLKPVDEDDYAAAAAGDYAWTPWAICESYAVKCGLLHARTGRPDAHAAGRRILQDAVDGVLPIYFWPPADAEASGVSSSE